MTAFSGPYHDAEGAEYFQCTLNGTTAADVVVYASLTFDGVVQNESRSNLTSADQDSLHFIFTVEDLRGHFGKRVGSMVLPPLMTFIYLFIHSFWNSKHSVKTMRTQQGTKTDKKGYKEAANICPERNII